MKNIIASILAVCVAIMIGSLFIPTSGEVEMPVVSVSGVPKAFQLGAFKDEKLALDMTEKLGGIMVKDNDYFYVYYSVLCDSSNIERMSKYLNNQNIYFYIKEININDVFSNELVRYEELMKETTTDIAFIELNKKIMNIYGETYEN